MGAFFTSCSGRYRATPSSSPALFPLLTLDASHWISPSSRGDTKLSLGCCVWDEERVKSQMRACPMFKVASDSYLDIRVLRYDVFSCPDILSGCSQPVQTKSQGLWQTCAIIVLCGSTAIQVPQWKSWREPREAPRWMWQQEEHGQPLEWSQETWHARE